MPRRRGRWSSDPTSARRGRARHSLGRRRPASPRPAASPAPSTWMSSTRRWWSCGRSAPRPISARARSRRLADPRASMTEKVELVVMDCALTRRCSSAISKRRFRGEGYRSHRPDPRNLRPARPHPRGRSAAGRTRAFGLPEARGWCAPGPISSASAAGSAFSAVRARRRSRPIGVSSPSEWRGSRSISNR